MKSGKTAVFGIGNILLSDDAVGPWVAHHLASGWRFPENVVVQDLGTPGLELTTYLPDFDTVLFVDAVAADAPVGSIRLYERDAIVGQAPGVRVGPHDPALGDTLLAMELTGEGPKDVLLVGIVVAKTTSGIGLTRAVREAVPSAAAVVLDLLDARGITPVATGDTQPAPWWESWVDESEAAEALRCGA